VASRGRGGALTYERAGTSQTTPSGGRSTGAEKRWLCHDTASASTPDDRLALEQLAGQVLLVGVELARDSVRHEPNGSAHASKVKLQRPWRSTGKVPSKPLPPTSAS